MLKALYRYNLHSRSFMPQTTVRTWRWNNLSAVELSNWYEKHNDLRYWLSARVDLEFPKAFVFAWNDERQPCLQTWRDVSFFSRSFCLAAMMMMLTMKFVNTFETSACYFGTLQIKVFSFDLEWHSNYRGSIFSLRCFEAGDWGSGCFLFWGWNSLKDGVTFAFKLSILV